MSGSERLAEILSTFHKLNLLVVGDLMLDRFIWGEVERLSPEAPVPVLRVCSESSRLGGAANVVHNVRSLGAQVTACGVVGADGPGKILIDDLQRIGASTTGVFADREVHSIQKTRVIARPSHQQIVRLDRENRTGIRDATLERICRFILSKAGRFDAILVSDYGKGVIHAKLLNCLANLAANKNVRLIIDPKRENYERYQRASLITPNKDEASAASGITIRDDRTLTMAGQRLLQMWRAKAVLITRGPEGMSLFRPRQAAQHFPTQPREVFDVTGAGNTVVAV
ncbi:MAG TPA: PfkB family carbohydrate kinase, partial [Candidatus Polarisedimenticolaceae bacterium]|nr:PfkB family carbohydrate kinase [Candidatus Polarisedimenticolaceae bacterium]